MNDKRIYGVQFSGHGSSYLPEKPVCNKTWNEAQAEAFGQEIRAAQIVNSDGICWGVEFAGKGPRYHPVRKPSWPEERSSNGFFPKVDTYGVN